VDCTTFLLLFPGDARLREWIGELKAAASSRLETIPIGKSVAYRCIPTIFNNNCSSA
jgi:hypothetical protein